MKCLTVSYMRESKEKSLLRNITIITWSSVCKNCDCESMLFSFEEVVKLGMNTIMPVKSIRIYL